MHLRQLAFFWLTSFLLATSGYFLLWAVLPGHWVFGALYRVPLYYRTHPLPYIALCCFSYGFLATWFSPWFGRSTAAGRVGITALLGLLTVGLSSPLGGVLWHLHDMQAGYFPADWARVLFVEGPVDGLAVGWLAVLLSVPYNALGLLVCYYLTRAGARRFRP